MSGQTEVITLAEAARRAAVTPATLKRWVDSGVVPLRDEQWTTAAAAHARLVSRLRDRGHSLEAIKQATKEGRLAAAVVEDLLPIREGEVDLESAARQTGLEEALIERIWSSIGIPAANLERLGEQDLVALRYVAEVLSAGFPLVALLQLVRVYGQCLRQIADAETHLVHMYVHEPLMQEGASELDIAEEMEGLVKDVLPFASPLMDFIHQRFLRYFVQQDVVGHMEADPTTEELGRLKVGIGFADLAGFTRFTEEAGEEEALDLVERFTRVVEETLPDQAKVVKTIGDEVMIVSTDPVSLTDWAVGFQQLFDERPLPRIGLHYGATIYRDGDYFGSEINLAARVTARTQGGEVLATKAILDNCPDSSHLEFRPIGRVSLKGFKDPIPLFTVSSAVT